MRAKYFSVMDRAVYLPEAIPSASSLIVASSNSKGVTTPFGASKESALSVNVKAGSAAAANPPNKPDFTKPLRDKRSSLLMDSLLRSIFTSLLSYLTFG
jgi:hypothetical protein